MLNLKITTLVIFMFAAAAAGVAGTALVMTSSSASADATAVLNCKPQASEPLRHVDPVNTGRNKEY